MPTPTLRSLLERAAGDPAFRAQLPAHPALRSLMERAANGPAFHGHRHRPGRSVHGWQTPKMSSWPDGGHFI